MRSAGKQLGIGAWLIVAAAGVEVRAQEIVCTTSVQADWTISMVDGAFGVLPLSPTVMPTLLGEADCLCDAGDLVADAVRVVRTLPQGAIFLYEVWSGSSCERVERHQPCEEVAAPETSISDYWTGSPRVPREPLPSSLVRPASGQCATRSVNDLYLLFFDNAGEPSVPNYCRFSLPQWVGRPAPPSDVVATADDRGVTLSWEPNQKDPPSGYQVLCAREDGSPLPGTGAAGTGHTPAPFELAYSTCLASGEVQRRSLPRYVGGAGPLGAPLLGRAGPGTPGPAPFSNLDRRFVCSGKVPASASGARVEGVPRGERLSFTVVSVDQQGNPAASPVVTVDVPAPAPPAEMPQLLSSGCAAAGQRRAPSLAWLVVVGLALATRSRRRYGQRSAQEKTVSSLPGRAAPKA